MNKETEESVHWQMINTDTYRLKVIGGWIVRVTHNHTNWIQHSGDQLQSTVSVTFVPDPDHRWSVKNVGYDFINIFPSDLEDLKTSNKDGGK